MTSCNLIESRDSSNLEGDFINEELEEENLEHELLYLESNEYEISKINSINPIFLDNFEESSYFYTTNSFLEEYDTRLCEFFIIMNIFLLFLMKKRRVFVFFLFRI